MLSVSAVALALLAGSASARTCTNITVPVTISARTAVFGNLAVPIGPLDPTIFILNQTRQGNNATAAALTGYNTTSGTYNISAKYCVPDGANATWPSTIQVLTHGIGFDKAYWDLPYNGYNYSYVNAALAAGYATLSYDRLGLGNSSHANTSLETRDTIQSTLQVASLAAMTQKLRNCSFPQVNHTFSKIVHVGHSFGSAQTYLLTAMYPNISDGIVLTGFSMNASFVGYFGAGGDFQQAYLNQPFRFGAPVDAAAVNTVIKAFGLTDYVAPIDFTALSTYNYVPGYLTNSNVNSQMYLFFYPNHFDNGILYYGEQTKQPVTTGELLTLASAPKTNAFKGPVLVFTGSNDLPYCGGDCDLTGNPALASIPASVKMNFPNASAFEAYIQPVTGHGLAFHYNATAGYNVIQSYLKGHSL